MRIYRNRRVPVQSDTRLAADLYLPGDDGRWPTIVMRTPYGKTASAEAIRPMIDRYLEAGYALLVQDVRGKGLSEGDFTPIIHEARDGRATLDWLVAQPWSNGRVGTFGCSYLGESQAVLAAERHPAHVTAVLSAAGGAMGSAAGLYEYFGSFENGVAALASLFGWMGCFGARHGPKLDLDKLSPDAAAQLERRFLLQPAWPQIDMQRAWRHLPLIDAITSHLGEAFSETYADYLSHPLADSWWDAQGYLTSDARFSIPALHVGAWYDYGVDATFALAALMSSNGLGPNSSEQPVLIFPTCHCAWGSAASRIVGERDLGDFASIGLADIQLAWFDRWLGDVPGNPLPAVQCYFVGESAWRSFASWPPPNVARRAWFVSSRLGANSRLGDGVLSRQPPDTSGFDRFTYDPHNPVPSLGGSACCTSLDPGTSDTIAGAFDQSDIELRHDVLVFTSAPLEAALVLAGPIEAEFFVSSSAPDTDFTLKVVEVTAAGVAYNLVETITRLRHREGVGQEIFTPPGEVVPITFKTHSIGARIAPGHRLRIEVSSSNFPRFARNLNTGGDNHRDHTARIAENSLFYGGDRCSRILIPELPA
jgi:hypothetical protein